MPVSLNDPQARTFVYVMLGVLTVIAVALLKLGRYFVEKWKEGAKEKVEWREFPARYGLVPTANSESGSAFEGRVDGIRVLVRMGASHVPQDERKRKPLGIGYVAIWAQCSQPQPAGLQLWAETKHDHQRKETRKLNEVIIGDEELDNALVIRGRHAGEIKALLCQPNLRDVLLEFFEHWPMSIVSDYWVKCEEDTAHAGIQSPEDMLRDALDLAKAFDQHAVKPQGLR